MNVLLITNDSDQSKALELLMLEEGINLTKVIKVVSINNVSASKKIKSKFRGVLGRVKGYLQRNNERSHVINFEHKCEKNADGLLNDFIKLRAKNLPKSTVDCVEVTNVNSETAISEISKEAPDLCVVFGVGIIKEKVLALADNFINAHTSILPHFKGTRSEFWQCFNNDLDSVGVTIHKIDKGIDTGKVYKQIEQKEKTFIEPYYLRYLNTVLILNQFPSIIKSIVNNELSPVSQVNSDHSRTYNFSEITLEKRMKLYSELMKTVK